MEEVELYGKFVLIGGIFVLFIGFYACGVSISLLMKLLITGKQDIGIIVIFAFGSIFQSLLV